LSPGSYSNPNVPREGYIAVKDADLYYRDLGQGQPVVILHGEQDFCPVACAAHIAGAIPRARLVVLEGCGHFAYLERPDAVHKEMAGFFESKGTH
jgi:pimeloyl-ACP methyl ester carboxylesterase